MLIIETMLKRIYPYGPLARRTIGIVRHNNELCNNHIGIEGYFNKALSGKDGYVRIPDYTRSVIPVIPVHSGCKIFN